MMWRYIIGILAVLFGIYQIGISIKYVKVIQQHGNKTTSNFSAVTVWYSFAFGLAVLILALCTMFNLF